MGPLVDRVKIPIFYRWLGQRRSWIFVCQILIFIGTLLLAGVNPAAHIWQASALAFLIATASATQDIAIDAFRIDSFAKSEESKLPQASAMAVIGWWTGYSLPGYLAFINADSSGWNSVFYGMAAIVVILMVFTLLVKEPNNHREQLQQQAEQRYRKNMDGPIMTWWSVTVVEPFADFSAATGPK